MASKTRKTRKTEAPEETLSRWLAGAVKGFSYDDLTKAGWEAGNERYITIEGVNYEQFEVPGGYVVVEWDSECGANVL